MEGTKRNPPTWYSISLSMNLKVQVLTFALRILLLLSISMLWSMMSSTCSVVEGNVEPLLRILFSARSYFCLLYG